MSIVVITSGILFVTRVYSTTKGAIARSNVLFRHSLLLEEAIFGFEEKAAVEKDLVAEGEFADHEGCSWRLDAKPVFEDNDDVSVVTLQTFRTNQTPPESYSLSTYLNSKG